jgi:hypothetical protein
MGDKFVTISFRHGRHPEKLASMNSKLGRVSMEEAAGILGFGVHDIPVLAQHKLLRPLGVPAPNAPKYFAACVLLKLANDPIWLDKATRAVSNYWKKKNRRRREKITAASDLDDA